VTCVLRQDPNSLTNSYIYAGAQILVQYAHSPDPNAADEKFYYVHDRLGSVRMVIGYDGSDAYVENHYTYGPFGQTLESAENTCNPFQFTGQWLDAEMSEYYLRARMYDPTMMRFTTRDPIRGEQNEPLTLHKYLYCVNDPIDRIDPRGELSSVEIAVVSGIEGAIWGALGGGLKGIIFESIDWMTDTDDGFEWSEVGWNALYGGISGALSFGTDINALRQYRSFAKILDKMFRGAMGAVIFDAIRTSTKGAQEVVALSAAHNLELEVAIVSWFE